MASDVGGSTSNSSDSRSTYISERLVKGQGRYIDDVTLPGMFHVGFVRSPHARAKIVKIDLDGVKAIPGVVTIITPEDLVRETTPFPLKTEAQQGLQFPNAKSSTTYALAVGEAHYVGEPVAAVLCDSPETCLEAIDAARVDYEPLPAVSDVESAVSQQSPLVYAEWGTNIMFERTLTKGDTGKAFQGAEKTIETRIEIARQAAGAIEPRGVVVDYDQAAGKWTLHSQTKAPFQTRDQLASILNVESDRVDVVVVDVGGSFGIKGRAYPEDVVACLFAKKVGKPVKWIATRSEDFLTSWQGRGQLHDIKVGFDSQGKILAIEDRFFIDVGSYWSFNLAAMRHAFGLSTGAYRIPSLKLEGSAVVTNKVPFGTVRGNGRPEAILIVERIVDLVARELGRDPLDVRLANIVTSAEMPYATGTGATLDSGDYVESIRLLKEMSQYDSLRKWQSEERAKGTLIGIGVSSYVEDTGGGSETADLSLLPDGRLRLASGASPGGQGIDGVLRKMVADEFGVAESEVEVICGNTTLIAEGTGTFGSRSAVLASNAAKMAVSDMKKKFARLESELRGGKEGSTSAVKQVTLAEIAREADGRGSLGEMRSFASFASSASTYSFGAHLAVVEVDPESFAVKLLRYFAVDDAGKVLNRQNVEGQIIGGIAHGVGNALLENFAFNENGQPISPTFADYLLPGPTDMPMVETIITETPSTMNPMGVRGVGEGGTIGGLATVISAVEDALSPMGIRITKVPANQSTVWDLRGKERVGKVVRPVAPASS